MKVLCIYPAFATTINEWAIVWKYLADRRLVDCRVITGGSDILKGIQSAEGIEKQPGLQIFRVPGVLAGGRLPEEVIRWGTEFKPDLIFCALQFNIVHARTFARRLQVPVLLHTEYWSDTVILFRRQYLGIPLLRPFVGRLLKAWHARKVSAVACSDPQEPTLPNAAPPVGYLAWPHPGSGTPPPVRDARRLDTLVHVGSLSHWKGAERLGAYCRHLLATDAQSKVIIVGPMGDATARKAIDGLQPWAGSGRFTYVERIPRAEAMQLIGSALAALAPHRRMSWGLMGDAWGCGTPLIGVDVHYDIDSGVNALVAPTADKFVAAVRRLRTDAALWLSLSEAGLQTAAKHSIESVASKLLQLLHSTTAQPGAMRVEAAAEPRGPRADQPRP